MDDLTRLRSTLEQHAGRLEDDALVERPLAARRRGRALRRRRRIAGSAAAAVVAALVGGTFVLTSGTGTRPDVVTVVGVQAPATLTSLGYTYELDRVVEGSDGAASLEVPTTEEPRLVAWATSGDDQRVTVRVEGDPPVTHVAGDFDDWVALDDDDDVPVAVTARVADGEVGLALYRLADPRPAGTTVSGVTFREDGAGYRLLDAVVGEPGETEVELTARGGSRGADVRAVGACVVDGAGAGGGGDLGARFEVAGRSTRPLTFYGCGDQVPLAVGPAAGADALPGYAGGGADVPLAAGEEAVVGFVASGGGFGGGSDVPEAESGLRLVLALYGRDATGDDPDAGLDPDLGAVVEQDGHLWRRATLDRAETGTVSRTVAADRGAVLVRYVVQGSLGGDDVRLTVDGRERVGRGAGAFPGGAASTLLVSPGATVQLEGTGIDPRYGGETQLATYVRAD